MSNWWLRVKLNKGRVGIPLGKLGRIAEETQRFLSLVDEDVGVMAVDSWAVA